VIILKMQRPEVNHLKRKPDIDLLTMQIADTSEFVTFPLNMTLEV
jgi:hypothetical protein